MGLAVLAPSDVLANGQSTHLWISHQAVEHLPEGPLRTLMEAHLLMVDNGTMFPDGGYPIDDEYGEKAHWEPFHTAYMDWLMQEQGYPYSGAGAEHAAFMLGMNSHGMADIVFDTFYMPRTQLYDGDSSELDTLSDVVMMSLVGGGFEPPEDWVPYDLFEELFLEDKRYEVTKATMSTGQALLRVAILAVASGASNPEDVAEAIETYPWGNTHLLDEDVPGSPACEGETISRYWQSQWELMNGRELYRPIFKTWPHDGAVEHELDSTSIDAWVSMVFARNLVGDEVGINDFEIRSEEGMLVPFNIGRRANVVHLKPTEDFEADTIYTVTVNEGLPDIHGGNFDGWSWTFSTGIEAPEPVNPPWGTGLDGSDGIEPGSDESESTSDSGDDTGAAKDVPAPATGQRLFVCDLGESEFETEVRAHMDAAEVVLRADMSAAASGVDCRNLEDLQHLEILRRNVALHTTS